MNKLTFVVLALMGNLVAPCASALTQEESDLQMANVAIVAGIAMGANEQTRTRCFESPCIGVSQAEIGMALIAARNGPESLKALSALTRFKLDGSLAEDYACNVLRKGPPLKRWIGAATPSQLRTRCVAEYGEVTRSHANIFPVSEPNLVCRTEAEIAVAQQALLDMLRAQHPCP
jgi:hypothetical protein